MDRKQTRMSRLCSVVFCAPSLRLFCSAPPVDQPLQEAIDSRTRTWIDRISATAKWKANPEAALQLLRDMKKEGLKPTTSVYVALMQSFLKKNRTLDTIQVFQEMQDDQVKPDLQTYHMLLNACCKDGDTERLEEVWKEMVASFKPDLVAYNIKMLALSKKR